MAPRPYPCAITPLRHLLAYANVMLIQTVYHFSGYTTSESLGNRDLRAIIMSISFHGIERSSINEISFHGHFVGLVALLIRL